MKVLAINGSARKGGNTHDMLQIALGELAKEGIETELIELGGKKVHGCLACGKCWEKKDRQCAIKNDDLNEILEKIWDADGLILGSPVYFSNVSAEMKALIDRTGMTNIANGGLLKRKVGGAAAVARRAGAVETFNAMNILFLHAQMIVPGSSYWNVAFGREKGEAVKDDEGKGIMRDLGQNMAWVLKKIGE